MQWWSEAELYKLNINNMLDIWYQINDWTVIGYEWKKYKCRCSCWTIQNFLKYDLTCWKSTWCRKCFYRRQCFKKYNTKDDLEIFTILFNNYCSYNIGWREKRESEFYTAFSMKWNWIPVNTISKKVKIANSILNRFFAERTGETLKEKNKLNKRILRDPLLTVLKNSVHKEETKKLKSIRDWVWKWHKLYDHCEECNTNIYKYECKWLCTKCYKKQYSQWMTKKQKEKYREKHKEKQGIYYKEYMKQKRDNNKKILEWIQNNKYNLDNKWQKIFDELCIRHSSKEWITKI